jgi:hypothetical protein
MYAQAIPAALLFVSGSITVEGSAAGDPYLDGDDGWYVDAATDSIRARLGDLAAGATDVCVTFVVVVDPNADADDDLTTEPEAEWENNEGDTFDDPTVDPGSEGTPGDDFDVQQIYALRLVRISSGTVFGDPEDVVTDTFRLFNDGNGADDFTFSQLYDNSSTDANFISGFLYKDSLEVALTGNVTIENLAADDDIIIVVHATFSQNVADGSENLYDFTATSDGSVADAGASTETATLQDITFVITAPVLAITKYVSLDETNWSAAVSAAPGTTVYYKLVVQNQGTGNALGIVIIDDLRSSNTTADPQGDLQYLVTINVDTPTSGSASEASRVITWNGFTLNGWSGSGPYPSAELTYDAVIDDDLTD